MHVSLFEHFFVLKRSPKDGKRERVVTMTVRNPVPCFGFERVAQSRTCRR